LTEDSPNPKPPGRLRRLFLLLIPRVRSALERLFTSALLAASRTIKGARSFGHFLLLKLRQPHWGVFAIALLAGCLSLIPLTHPYWPFYLLAVVEGIYLTDLEYRKPKSLATHAVLILLAYTIYQGLKPQVVLTNFNEPSGDSAAPLPFSGETIRAAVADSMKLIRDQAAGQPPRPLSCIPPPQPVLEGCGSNGGVTPTWQSVQSPDILAIKQDNPEPLEVNGISLNAVQVYVQRVVNNQVMEVTGDVVLVGKNHFQLESRTSNGGGPWPGDPKPATEAGMRAAACSVAEHAMESFAPEMDTLAAA
jgi:hypothetical protein